MGYRQWCRKESDMTERLKLSLFCFFNNRMEVTVVLQRIAALWAKDKLPAHSFIKLMTNTQCSLNGLLEEVNYPHLSEVCQFQGNTNQKERYPHKLRNVLADFTR